MFSNSTSAGMWLARWITAASILAFIVPTVWAEESSIIRIEEDWEMVVAEPSPNSDAPQVTCAISPLPNMDSYGATFVVNSHEVPDFTAGGLQLQGWDGEELLASQHSPNQALLATPGEVIRWTQVMQKTAEGVEFQIVNGTSTTWGSFGGGDNLKIQLPAPIPSLNGYNSEVSVENSGVSYAGNRVQSLVLKKVRAYTAQGLSAEDNNPKIVHELDEGP